MKWSVYNNITLHIMSSENKSAQNILSTDIAIENSPNIKAIQLNMNAKAFKPTANFKPSLIGAMLEPLIDEAS
jgi:hypothetical protein